MFYLQWDLRCSVFYDYKTVICCIIDMDNIIQYPAVNVCKFNALRNQKLFTKAILFVIYRARLIPQTANIYFWKAEVQLFYQFGFSNFIKSSQNELVLKLYFIEIIPDLQPWWVIFHYGSMVECDTNLHQLERLKLLLHFQQNQFYLQVEDFRVARFVA